MKMIPFMVELDPLECANVTSWGDGWDADFDLFCRSSLGGDKWGPETKVTIARHQSSFITPDSVKQQVYVEPYFYHHGRRRYRDCGGYNHVQVFPLTDGKGMELHCDDSYGDRNFTDLIVRIAVSSFVTFDKRKGADRDGPAEVHSRRKTKLWLGKNASSVMAAADAADLEKVEVSFEGWAGPGTWGPWTVIGAHIGKVACFVRFSARTSNPVVATIRYLNAGNFVREQFTDCCRIVTDDSVGVIEISFCSAAEQAHVSGVITREEEL
jgi:hypothetical protein